MNDTPVILALLFLDRIQNASCVFLMLQAVKRVRSLKWVVWVLAIMINERKSRVILFGLQQQEEFCLCGVRIVRFQS